MIEPIEIAKAVIAALETDQSRTVYLPWISSTLWALRGLPTWVGDGVLWVRCSLLLPSLPLWSSKVWLLIFLLLIP